MQRGGGGNNNTMHFVFMKITHCHRKSSNYVACSQKVKKSGALGHAASSSPVVSTILLEWFVRTEDENSLVAGGQVGSRVVGR